jgi:hypothetical protein
LHEKRFIYLSFSNSFLFLKNNFFYFLWVTLELFSSSILGESHPRVAAGIKKNAMTVRENFGNLARLIIRENFGDLGNLVAAVGSSLI